MSGRAGLRVLAAFAARSADELWAGEREECWNRWNQQAGAVPGGPLGFSRRTLEWRNTRV